MFVYNYLLLNIWALDVNYIIAAGRRRFNGWMSK